MKLKDYPKFVWAVLPDGNFKGCLDIRRYAYDHNSAVSQLKGSKHRCEATKGTWTLFKLVRVNKRRPR